MLINQRFAMTVCSMCGQMKGPTAKATEIRRTLIQEIGKAFPELMSENEVEVNKFLNTPPAQREVTVTAKHHRAYLDGALALVPQISGSEYNLVVGGAMGLKIKNALIKLIDVNSYPDFDGELDGEEIELDEGYPVDDVKKLSFTDINSKK